MAGSVREVRPGVWDMRLYTGKDPLTGKKTQASRHVRASGKREAQAQCDRWAFGDLAAQWIAVKQRRWPPNTLQEHRRIVARNLRPLHDVDVAKITTHTLDVLYAELGARGGPCPTARARWRHASNTGRGAENRSASDRRVHTTGPAGTRHHAKTNRAGTARRCRPPASTGSTPSFAQRSARP